MSIYGISSVKLDHAGEIIEASIAPIDPETRQPGIFVAQPAKNIASMIIGGDDVRGYFWVDGTNVLGAKFVAVVHGGGQESIELEPNDIGWSITDVGWREV